MAKSKRGRSKKQPTTARRKPATRLARSAARATFGKGSFRGLRELGKKRPTSRAEKEKALAKIGIRPFQSARKRTPKQKRQIDSLYSEFSEFTSRSSEKVAIVKASPRTAERARKAGMAVYQEKYRGFKVVRVKVKGKYVYERHRVTKTRLNIYVHKAKGDESVKLSRFMGEQVIARTYYGKLERIFLGGADTFERVVRKLQAKPLAPGQMVTGAFFGGPTFHRAIYANVGDFLNYLNNQFVPHLGKGEKPTRRNVARAKAALIKNIAIVEITNPEFESDEDGEA